MKSKTTTPVEVDANNIIDCTDESKADSRSTIANSVELPAKIHSSQKPVAAVGAIYPPSA